jgi:hypothetical protein
LLGCSIVSRILSLLVLIKKILYQYSTKTKASTSVGKKLNRFSLVGPKKVLPAMLFFDTEYPRQKMPAGDTRSSFVLARTMMGMRRDWLLDHMTAILAGDYDHVPLPFNVQILAAAGFAGPRARRTRRTPIHVFTHVQMSSFPFRIM